MTSTVVLITGANTGIGFQIVRALCSSSRPYNIILGGRSPSKIQEAISAVKKEFSESQSVLHAVEIDIGSDDSINKAFKEVSSKFQGLDVLVNNAGAQFDQQLYAGALSEREMWNKSWNVNTTGTQITTSTFVPLLLQSSDPRLLFVASGTSSLDGTDNQMIPVNRYPAKGWPKSGISLSAYRSAKTGLNMLMREWHRILHEDGVKVWSISPGYLATGLGGDQTANESAGAGDPKTAGPFFRSIIEGERDRDVGKVITMNGVQSW